MPGTAQIHKMIFTSKLAHDPCQWISLLNIKINTNGGKGGRGGAPKYASASRGINGRNGDDGTLKTESKSVVLDF